MKAIGTAALFLFTGLVLAQQPALTGRLLDLGGRRLHLNCSGSGSPTVIVENGGGGFSVDWALVQPEIAKTMRICTYDRAGYAWSDRGPAQDSVEQTVDDLTLLLSKADVRPPYVMVGASLGALYIRAYQRRFPANVTGLVFVDGSHDEAITLVLDGKSTPISQLSAEQLKRAYQEYRRAAPKPRDGPADQEPLNRLPPALRQARHWALERLIADVGLLPAGEAAAGSWRQEFTTLRLQRTGQSHPLGDMPLIVIERGIGSNETWHLQQTQLAALSSTGKLVRAETSGHMIHLYQPDLVVQAIREILARVSHRPTPAP